LHPAIRLIGRVLSLVGISSPEDNAVQNRSKAGVPSWRDPVAQAKEPESTLPVEPPTR
jgi:hypothetical protein